MAQQTLLRLPVVIQRSGLARSTIYKSIAAGVWTRPVKISARAVAWPSTEIDALLGARVAGSTVAHIRELVVQLYTARRDAGVATA